MDSSSLQSLLSNAQNSGADPIGSLLEPLMPLLTLLAGLSIVLSVAFIVYAIVNTVQKQRQHAAIMRIDKNLQKLVDMRVEAVRPQPTEVAQPAAQPEQS